MTRTGYVVFCEDKKYLLWQTELLIQSLTKRAQVSRDDIVVLFADPAYHNKNNEYSVSPYMSGIISCYSPVRFHCVQNWGRKNWYYRFKDDGSWYPKQYPGINKWLSLCEAANAGWLDDFDEVLLLEQDLWFSGTIPELPPGNCVTDNWINNRYRAFEVTDKEVHMNTVGFDLDDIMKLCKVPPSSREKWVGGAIIFKFVTDQLKKGKFLNSIVNYNQLLMTLGELALPQGARHETDMVAPSLAMAHCGMDCTLIQDLQWRSDVWTWHEEPPTNTVVHYGWDFAHYPHLKCPFSKFKYNESLPWDDRETLLSGQSSTTFTWVKSFIDDLLEVGEMQMDRTCNNQVSIPVI